MIGYLKGKVLEIVDGRLLLTIPAGGAPGPTSTSANDCGAVGYSVTVPQSAAYGLLGRGQWLELYIHTHVREDALDLYGFASPIEKELFLTLLSVSGIGPKGAMGILSGAEPSELVSAIISGDKDFLTSIPGIGKKTAERVVLELADPLRKKSESGALVLGGVKRKSDDVGAGRAAGAAAGKSELLRDSKDALIGLGYREQDISGLLNRILAEASDEPIGVEDVVRRALRQMTLPTGQVNRASRAESAERN